MAPTKKVASNDLSSSALDQTSASNRPEDKLDQTTDSNRPDEVLDHTTDSNRPEEILDQTTDSSRPDEVLDHTTDSNRPVEQLDQTTDSNRPASFATSNSAQSADLSNVNEATLPSNISGLDREAQSKSASKDIVETFDSQRSQRRSQDDDIQLIAVPSGSRRNRSGKGAPSEPFDSFPELVETKDGDGNLEMIGRYQVKKILGEGSFGRVYEAHGPQLDRRVAIKIAKMTTSKSNIERFQREARAAARLRHPNIIPVYEYGMVSGQNIIVYQFVAGETLKAFIKRHNCENTDETVAIIKAIAEGLNYAHEEGIIHRDIKPDNILIDPQGRPHIADFGCARSLDDQTELTTDGSLLGTPMYMSPEQASGKAHLADGKTDIWSLGVIMYEMVTGQKPFRGQMSDLLHWICNNDAKPIRKITPNAPVELETICEKCLTRSLSDRIPNGKFLAQELDRFQRGEPIQSRRIGPLRRTWMWAKRNPTVAGCLATVAATLLVGTIVSTNYAYLAAVSERNRAFAQLETLTTSDASSLPRTFSVLKDFRKTMLPMLREQLTKETKNFKSQHRIRMAILELEDDPEQRKQLSNLLTQDLLNSDAGDFFIGRERLLFRRPELTERFWKVVLDTNEDSTTERRFRAAAALALFDPHAETWDQILPDVVGHLTSLDQVEMSQWLPSFAPIRERLRPELVKAFNDRSDPNAPSPQNAAAIISRLFQTDLEFLVGLLASATPRQIPFLTKALEANKYAAISELQTMLQERIDQAKNADSQGTLSNITHTANLVIAMLQLGDNQWSQFAQRRDMSISTELIERLGPSATGVDLLIDRIDEWRSADPDVLAGILLSLGQFKSNQIQSLDRERILQALLNIFVDHPDSRVHSSARWLLRRWGREADVQMKEKQLSRAQPEPGKNWHVDLAGNTFALFGPIDSFEMGLSKKAAHPDFNIERIVNEPVHRKRIPRRFGISINEVTVGQFVDFEKELQELLAGQIPVYQTRKDQQQTLVENLSKASNSQQATPSAESTDAPSSDLETAKKKLVALTRMLKALKNKVVDSGRRLKRREKLAKELPVSDVDFFTAIQYCRWMSDQQSLNSALPSMERLAQIVLSKEDHRFTQTHLEQDGYRIPTASEREFASQGETHTLFPFGRNTAATKHYAWFANNSNAHRHPVGMLKPGNSGLFDDLGNVSEWCLDWYVEQLPTLTDPTTNLYTDFGKEFENHRSLEREYRGGSFADEVFDVRAGRRFSTRSFMGFPRLGFRLARTYE